MTVLQSLYGKSRLLRPMTGTFTFFLDITRRPPPQRKVIETTVSEPVLNQGPLRKSVYNLT